MASPNILVVTGATGNIGSKLAQELLSKGTPVRVIGRSEEKLRNFAAKGAEPFVGSLEDIAFVTKAFSDAKAVFAMIPPKNDAPDFKLYQNKVSEALATAIKNSGVKYVVNLSSVGAHLSQGGGPINGLAENEGRLNKIPGLNVLHLRPSYFMENLLSNLPLIKNMGMMGSMIKADLKIAMIATRDIAAEASKRLLKLDFTGVTVKELLGERDLTHTEVAGIIGNALSKDDLTYVQFAYENAEKTLRSMGFSTDMARLYTEMARGFNEGHLKPVSQRSKENTTSTSIEEFAKTFAAVYDTTFSSTATVGSAS